ncbi:MAG: acyltransferase family protein [Devosiaceae bacterium]|nr:acyltransferase family protein [Devosiaceae bacterium MH13]
MGHPPKAPSQDPALFLTADGRVDWVDVAKGICIVFVVMMHSTLGVQELTGENSWMGTFVAWAQPFRMPDFFFIAGLFLMKTIDAPWRRFVDRKIVHFAYFYLLWMVIQGVMKGGLLTGDPGAVPGVLLTALYEPFGTLWFIYMLPIFFLVVRFTRRVPIWAMLGLGAALEIAPIGTGYLLVDEFCSRFVYFYAGYALAPHVFRIAEEVRAKPALALAFLIAWSGVNAFAVFTPVELFGELRSISHVPVVSLSLGALGAMAVVSTAVLLSRTKVGAAFSYMGARSIVIYLAFFLPMVIVREAGIRFGLIPDTAILSVVTTFAAVTGPLVGYWIIETVKPFGAFRFLFERPQWARIERAGDRAPRAAIAPAE